MSKFPIFAFFMWLIWLIAFSNSYAQSTLLGPEKVLEFELSTTQAEPLKVKSQEKSERIKSKELYGKWVRLPEEGDRNIVVYHFFDEVLKDNTIPYDGLYNGELISYVSIGGYFAKKEPIPPIVWDIIKNGRIISIDLWTEVDEQKGHRMTWSFEWEIIKNDGDLLTMNSRLTGLDDTKPTKIQLGRCGSKHIQIEHIKEICHRD